MVSSDLLIIESKFERLEAEAESCINSVSGLMFACQRECRAGCWSTLGQTLSLNKAQWYCLSNTVWRSVMLDPGVSSVNARLPPPPASLFTCSIHSFIMIRVWSSMNQWYCQAMNDHHSLQQCQLITKRIVLRWCEWSRISDQGTVQHSLSHSTVTEHLQHTIINYQQHLSQRLVSQTDIASSSDVLVSLLNSSEG